MAKKKEPRKETGSVPKERLRIERGERIELTPDEIKKIEALSSRGLTMVQIAACLGISRTTLFARVAESEEVKWALARGRSRGVAEIANSLFDSAKAGNIAAQIFYLKNRDPSTWSNDPKPDGDGEEVLPVQIVFETVDGSEGASK